MNSFLDNQSEGIWIKYEIKLQFLNVYDICLIWHKINTLKSNIFIYSVNILN